MIDTKNLRMLAHDFKLAGSPVFIQVSQMNELLDRIEMAEKERCDATSQITQQLSRLADENVRLRARIDEMEEQEPIGEMREISHLNWELAWFRPVPFGAKLFTSPGAKGE